MHWICHGAPGTRLKALEKGRHITRGITIQNIQRIGIECIDTRIDMATGNWLFLESDNIHTVDLNYAEGMLPFVHPHGHGSHSRMAYMKIQQLPIVNIGKNVTIRHHEWCIRARIKKTQGPSRA